MKKLIIILNIFAFIAPIISTDKAPRVSIITSVYNGDEFIAGFLSDITRMTIFSESELILINANSPGNEEPIIKEYLKKFPNIIYKKLDNDPGLYAVWNMAIKMAKADYITNANLDDRRNSKALEEHVTYLETNPNIDLVYAGYYITYQPNETFEFNNYRWHVESIDFFPKNMQLCLAGPMPTWRKNMHMQYGYFDERFSSSGDFEMWNRAASQGSKFKALPGYSGLYYQNPTGVSTDNDNSKKIKRDRENSAIVSQYHSYWDGPTCCICTACDSNYYPFLINLIGSIHKTNFDNIAEIAVFNLGLDKEQLSYLNTIKKVRVYEVEKVNPDIIKPITTTSWGKQVPGLYAWKPVVIKQALDMFETVLWLDAGTTVLKSIEHLFKYIKEHGHLICAIGDGKSNNNFTVPIRWQTTQYLIDKFDLNSANNNEILDKEIITANIIGASKSAYKRLVEPFYELASDIKNFEHDGSKPAGFVDTRHDQSVLGVLSYLNNLKIHVQDYSQTHPINLEINNSIEPFYITWDHNYVCDKTHIYHSRGDISNANHYNSYIKFKEKKIEEKSFVIVIPSYNNKDWYQKNLDSVFMQKYNNYRVIYIDDCSPDNTGKLVEEYIKEHKQESKFTIIKNTERKLALANHYNAVHSCKPNEIIINLDGDDSLADENVLTYLNNVYQDNNVWLTYGQFKWHPNYIDWACSQIPNEIINNNEFRHYDCAASHLRSFYATLFQRIKKEDFMNGDKFYPMACDVAMMYPMLEMAGIHSKFIPKVLYIYNNANQLNDHKTDPALQNKLNAHIRSLPKYQPLNYLFKEQN